MNPDDPAQRKIGTSAPSRRNRPSQGRPPAAASSTDQARGAHPRPAAPGRCRPRARRRRRSPARSRCCWRRPPAGRGRLGRRPCRPRRRPRPPPSRARPGPRWRGPRGSAGGGGRTAGPGRRSRWRAAASGSARLHAGPGPHQLPAPRGKRSGTPTTGRSSPSTGVEVAPAAPSRSGLRGRSGRQASALSVDRAARASQVSLFIPKPRSSTLARGSRSCELAHCGCLHPDASSGHVLTARRRHPARILRQRSRATKHNGPDAGDGNLPQGRGFLCGCARRRDGTSDLTNARFAWLPVVLLRGRRRSHHTDRGRSEPWRGWFRIPAGRKRTSNREQRTENRVDIPLRGTPNHEDGSVGSSHGPRNTAHGMSLPRSPRAMRMAQWAENTEYRTGNGKREMPRVAAGGYEIVLRVSS